MDRWIGENRQTLALGVAAVFFVAAVVAGWNLLLLLLAGALVVLGLFGDQVVELAIGAQGFKVRLVETVKEAAQRIEGTGDVRVPAPSVSGQGTVARAGHASATVTAHDATVKTLEGSLTIDAWIAEREETMRTAKTPEELGEAIVEYVKAAEQARRGDMDRATGPD